MRLMPSRYVGDMCSRPSTSLPLLMRCSVAASVFSSALTAMVILSSHGLEIAAAGRAAILAGQQLRAKQRDQLTAGGGAERATHPLRLGHQVPAHYRFRLAPG